ncbi:DUF485 domain-containing protein [Burkholderia cenocepacia]|uniref:DUF485 domain-containing protein n=1 Tax=Burkholderia cenocepacia TaxID=95486 RepID=UPI00163A0C9A|nr:DUF485 domain-containing protein [Burkholderia cenocepacia]
MTKTPAAPGGLRASYVAHTPADSLAQRVRRRRRASIGFCTVLLGVYWAFVYGVTAKLPGLNGLVTDGLSVALMLGIVLIVGCLVSTLLYVVLMSRVERTESVDIQFTHQPEDLR